MLAIWGGPRGRKASCRGEDVCVGKSIGCIGFRTVCGFRRPPWVLGHVPLDEGGGCESHLCRGGRGVCKEVAFLLPPSQETQREEPTGAGRKGCIWVIVRRKSHGPMGRAPTEPHTDAVPLSSLLDGAGQRGCGPWGLPLVAAPASRAQPPLLASPRSLSGVYHFPAPYP